MSQVTSTLPPILCIPLFIGVADAVEATWKGGGAYVPEILYKCVTELQQAYKPIIESEEFAAYARRSDARPILFDKK